MPHQGKATEKQLRAEKRNSRAKSRARRKKRKRLDRIDSCIGKIKHKDKYGAIAHLKKLNKADMSLYQCRHCKFWHIGHRNRKIQDRLDQLFGRVIRQQ